MSRNDKTLRGTQHTPPFGRRQGPARGHTVGASVTPDEEAEILRALEAAGYPSVSAGARDILLAFARRGRRRAA